MTKRHVTETIVSLIIGMTLFFVITGVNGVYGGKLSGVKVARFLCDGFFVAGVVLLGFAALYWASDKGAFDGLKFSFTSFVCTCRGSSLASGIGVSVPPILRSILTEACALIVSVICE